MYVSALTVSSRAFPIHWYAQVAVVAAPVIMMLMMMMQYCHSSGHCCYHLMIMQPVMRR
jgi:hypothetical protein